MASFLATLLVIGAIVPGHRSPPAPEPRDTTQDRRAIVALEHAWLQARTVFTDVFMYRAGRWQAINAQENVVTRP